MRATRSILFAFGCLALTAACTQHDKEPVAEAPPDTSELKWARAALERNPGLKVEAVDEAKQTIRVRVKASGDVVSVTTGELAAIPISDLVALTNTPRVAQTETSPPRVVEEPIPPEPEAPAQAQPPERKSSDYKVEREGGRVRITGPGVNIESTGNDGQAQGGISRKFDEPIICEGRRTLFLDQRRMNVSGDAIIARGGCEIHLANSQITATGTGIIVQDATVHVTNSTVQGNEASVDVAAAANLFSQNTQFIGISRRDPQAKIVDQGGTTWR